jgi:hypothetical protein
MFPSHSIKSTKTFNESFDTLIKLVKFIYEQTMRKNYVNASSHGAILVQS